MVGWGWSILLFLVGVILGGLLLILLTAKRDFNAYWAGYGHGHQDGFRDGMHEVAEIG